MNLSELLLTPEGKTIEFKRDLSLLKPILKSLVAFANTAGGTLVIGRVLRELGLLEEWGTGYRRVLEDCQAGGYPAPDWQELGPALRVVFRPHPSAVGDTDVSINVSVNVSINDRQRWFLEQLSAGVPVRASDIAGQFQVAERTARRDIADLESERLIEFVGARKTGSYRLRENP